MLCILAPLAPAAQVEWGSYIGGDGIEMPLGSAGDPAGNTLAVGFTTSTDWFTGGFDSTIGGFADGYLVKFTPTGQIAWGTLLGGEGMEMAYAVATDAQGNIYVVGSIDADGWAVGGGDTSFNGETDAFVIALSPTGTRLWSTYLGGSAEDYATGIAIADNGALYVTGTTSSAGWLQSGHDTSHNGLTDAFVVRLSPANGTILWGTYLGGNKNDDGWHLAADHAGNVAVIGNTLSSGWVSGGFQSTHNGSAGDPSQDAFIAKLSSTGQLLWSSYAGGINDEEGHDIACTSANEFIIAGRTGSSGWMTGGYDSQFGGSSDSFAIKVLPNGQVAWRTYVGGNNYDEIYAVAVNAANELYLAGESSSTDLITGGPDTTLNGSSDATLLKLAIATGAPVWSTFLGGSGHESAMGLVVAPDQTLRVTGSTSVGGWLSGGADTTYSTSMDDFILKLSDSGASPTGGLKVTLEPPAAVTAGAQWRRVGTTAWLDSATSISNVPTGAQRVEFKLATNYATPTTMTLTVLENKTTTATATYLPAGALTVAAGPAAARASGAQWRRTGTTPWLAPDALEQNIVAGPHTVEFNKLNGWRSPAPILTTITATLTSSLAADYTSVPSDVSWSTYLGVDNYFSLLEIGMFTDFYGNSLAVDPLGNVYIATTVSNKGSVTGGYDTTYNGGSSDACLVKLSPAGEFLWSTYIGGSDWEFCYGLAVDAQGNAYVVGETQDGRWASASSYTMRDGFISKISPTGQHVWTRLIGGDSYDAIVGITIDHFGYLGVCGVVSSPGMASSGFDTSYNGGGDIYVARLNPSGTILWSTYAGGAQDEMAIDITSDLNTNFYVTGTTRSPDWPLNGYDTESDTRGNYDGFVIKISPTGAHVWSTYLGGDREDDNGRAIDVDPSGNVYVVGKTSSTGWINGGSDTTLGGTRDGFLVKLNSSGQHLWSTYLGGDYIYDEALGIVINPTGTRLYLSGHTGSSGWLTNAFDAQLNGGDAYLLCLDPAGTQLWGSYLGGTNNETGFDIALDGQGSILTCGSTQSSGWVAGGYDTLYDTALNPNNFVAKIHEFGELVVNIKPQHVVNAGACWRPVGSAAWLPSGALLEKLPTDGLTLEFLPVPGAPTPAPLQVPPVVRGERSVLEVYYGGKSALAPESWLYYAE